MRSIMSQMWSFLSRKKASEVEGHYAQHFPKFRTVKEDDFNNKGSAGPHGDSLSLKKASKLKDHRMSYGIWWTLDELHYSD